MDVVERAREMSNTKEGRDHICSLLGMTGKDGRYWCPFCQSDSGHKTPDFSTTEGMYCHKCGWKGDGIKLVMELRGIDFPSAVEFLTGEPPPAKKAKQKKKTGKIYPDFQTAVKKFSYYLKMNYDYKLESVYQYLDDERKNMVCTVAVQG